jgi:hypothetical protein
VNEEIYQFKVRPIIQKCQSIRFEISDYNPTIVDGSGFSVVGLVLDIGVKTGTFRVPTTKVMT